ncbi:MAG: CueP family metal-binding protein [Propioniciclava sp.]
MTSLPCQRTPLGHLTAVGILCLILLVTGCAASPTAPATTATVSAEELLAPYDLAGLDAAAVIADLETRSLDDRPEGLLASVQPNALVLTDAAGAVAELPIPEDRFYVSIAPYVESTHECGFHSLTTCRGELGNEPVTVTITNVATDQVIVDVESRTAPNGFIGLWVPRADELAVTIAAQGKSATATISTSGADDLTCITTMQLS